MFKDIALQHADGTQKIYSFIANGTTAYRYNQLFRKELMAGITGIIGAVGADNLKKLMEVGKKVEASGSAELSVENMDAETLAMVIAIVGSGEMNTIPQMAFIMNQQAEHADMNTLNFEKYLDWMENFESMELITHAMDFIALYTGNRQTVSTPKKDPAQLTEK